MTPSIEVTLRVSSWRLRTVRAWDMLDWWCLEVREVAILEVRKEVSILGRGLRGTGERGTERNKEDLNGQSSRPLRHAEQRGPLNSFNTHLCH